MLCSSLLVLELPSFKFQQQDSYRKRDECFAEPRQSMATPRVESMCSIPIQKAALITTSQRPRLGSRPQAQG
jgi:hypothetical protein